MQHRNVSVRGSFPFLAELSLVVCLASLLCVPARAARAGTGTADDGAERRASAQGQFAKAEALRVALEAKPERQRSLADYKDLISAYHRVYLITPHAVEVPQALLLVADYYRRMGEQFEPSFFESAVESYEFLVHEYPTTKFRDQALLAIAEIQGKNLGERNLSEQNYEQFLDRYPNSPLAPQAKAALAGMRSGDRVVSNAMAKGEFGSALAAAASAQPARAAASSAAPNSPAATPAKASANATTTAPAPASGLAKGPLSASAMKGGDVPAAAPGAPGGQVSGQISGQVSGLSHIRVWNADTYTRIIIDLGSEAKYKSARISNPDRIYFDIENAKVAGELLHEPVEVPAGGYLKTVRVAQNREDVVRVVLEVAQVKDYSVFELSDPDRLVVDVYGPNALEGSKTVMASAAPGKTVLPSPVSDAATPIRSPFAPKTDVAPAAAPAAASARANTAPAAPAATRDTKPTAELAAAAPSGDVRSAAAPSVAASAKAPAAAADAPAAAKAADAGASGALRASAGASSVTPKAQPTSTSMSASAATTSATLNGPGNGAGGADSAKNSVRKAAADIGPASLPGLTQDGERSLTRALGLKVGRIVIDPGHGGHDTGTIGPGGLMEKDLCLDVALRLGKLIQERLPSAEVLFTRNDDSFVPLEQRTAMANDAKADLFISIHANSSSDHKVGGVETYYLNFNASPDAMQVATRENAVAQASVHDLEDLVNKIARNEKIEESRDLAKYVQESVAKRSVSSYSGEHNRGVRRAPFLVLIGANMPSVLAEVSFLSNPSDEQWLKKPDSRERLAEGLYRGIENYLQSTNSLSSNLDPPSARSIDVVR